MDDLGKAREHLRKFEGGEITLDKMYWDKGIAIIRFKNPSKKNAVSGKMMIDLEKCIHELEKWDEGKAVILHGEGDNFCAGGDLNFALKVGSPSNPEGTLYMSNWMISTLSRLSNLDMLSVCIAQGPTLGGGAEISTYCDYILVTEDVKYGFVQGKLGITTAWGGGTKLIQKLGHRKAMDLFLTSRILSSKECVFLGVAEKVISSSNVLEDALLWLNEYLIHHYQVIRSFKRLVNTSKKGDVNETFRCERTSTSILWGGEKNKKNITKFLENRAKLKNNNK